MLRRRLLVLLVLGLAGLTGLTGCRTSPTVAAYVGDERVTVDTLDAAVNQRQADPDIATFAAKDEVGFTRQVLSLLVAERVYAQAAQHYQVHVSDADVSARIGELLAGNDPAAVYRQLAQQQGVNVADVRENVRQQLIRQRVAVAAGKADLSEAALRQRYQQGTGRLAQVQLGLITVPDQSTADAVRAQLTANPASYPALAAKYPGSATLPQISPLSPDQLPSVLSSAVAATAPGHTFTVPVAQVGGVVVGFVGETVVPPFADVHDQLAQQAVTDADKAGAALIEAFRNGLHITVNPRYGVLDAGKVVAGDGGVVKILTDAGTAAAQATGN